LTPEPPSEMHGRRGKSGRAVLQTLPVIAGTVLLTSLALAVVSPDQAAGYFGRSDLGNALLAAAVGSIAAGPPLASYVLGGELSAAGVGLLAVTALVVSWVTVGLVQLPAEAMFLGTRFAIVRNITSFVFALAVAWLTVRTLHWLGMISA